MALRTDIWVRGHLRRCFAQGLTGAVAHKGNPEAGAVYVRVWLSAQAAKLYAPAPGPAYDDSGSRRWTRVRDGEALTGSEAEAYVAKQLRFDPDLWIVDIDDRDGTGLLDLARPDAETQ